MPRPRCLPLGVGGALILALTLGACAGPPRQAGPGPATTEVSAPGPTGSPGQSADAPTPRGETPVTPTPPRAEPFRPLLYDDFTRLTSGWTPLFVDAQGSVNGYSEESFAFSTARPGQLLYNILPGLSFAPTRYSVEILPGEGAGLYGLLLEVRGELADFPGLAFYGIGLASGGDLVLLVKGAGGELQLLPVAEKIVAPPAAAPVRLMVDRLADRLVVRVGDAEAVTVAAPAPEGGTVGFFARAETKLSVRFDNLLLTTGEAGPEPPCAGIRPLFAQPGSGAAISGEDVTLAQRRLARLGYAPESDGAYGQATAAAVRQLQARSGLPADGIVGPDTWCVLLSGEAVLAGQGQGERAASRGRYRAVAIDPEAELPAPLLVSVRDPERRWQIALALPGRGRLHYIDTGGDAFDPAWLPERGLLAFASVRGGADAEAIWMLDTVSGEVRQVSPADLKSKYPSWSPDGAALMFTGEKLDGNDREARNYLYTTADGRVTPWGGERAGWADWSPLGTVVFTRWTGRSFDLFAASADGGDEVNLTNTDDYHEDIAAWSPGGDRIVFVRNPKSAPDDRQLYIMQADGSGAQPITSLPGPNSNPIWLDASTIVFAHQSSPEVRQPYLLRLPGDLRQLSASEERVWFMQRLDRGP